MASDLKEQLSENQYELVFEQNAKIEKTLESLYLSIENLFKKLHKVLRPLSPQFKKKKAVAVDRSRQARDNFQT